MTQDQDHLAAASNGSPGGAPDVDILRGLDTPTRVRFYEHDFYVLSNFSAFTLYWRGLRFDTSEAAYHFEKFPTYPRIRERIKNAPSAHEAFKIAEAEKHMRRPDWDDVKVSIMRNLLREKAKQHEYVRRKLLATGDRELVEDSWRDDFWGWGPNRDGQNMLGKLWMEVRAELRSAAASPDGTAKLLKGGFMHDDLIARLRAMSRREHDDLSIGDEAADALEAMQAELSGKTPRWWTCATHGAALPHNAWGCPECVREMRADLAAMKQPARR